jgi:hypothetical protein
MFKEDIQTSVRISAIEVLQIKVTGLEMSDGL